MQNAQSPRLPLKIMRFAIFDVIGMIFLATGALMLWSAARILHELIKQPAKNLQGGK